MTLRSPLLIGVILLLGLIWANQHGQPDGQLATLEQSASAQWAVALSLTPDTVAVGNLDLAVKISSARSGYLTLLERGTDGKVGVIFPNALDQDSRIEAGQPLTLPRDHWKLRAAPPAGEGRLLALVTEHPLDQQALKTLLSSTPAALSSQPYGAASAHYLEQE